MNRRPTASPFWLACLATACLYTLPATANDFFQTIELDSPRAATTQSDRWRYRAYLLQELKYGLRTPAADGGFERQQAGISQVKTHAFAQFNGTVNPNLAWQLSAKGESQWYQWQENQGEWRNHNNQLRLRDALVDVTSAQGTWLRLGQQVLAWGQAEGLTVLDVLSPLDLREPGQAELQDIREPVPAAQLTLPLNHQWHLTAVTTYQAESHRYAGAGQAFHPFAGFRAAGLSVEQRDRQHQWEFAGKLTGQFHGGDVLLMAARFNDRDLALLETHPAEGVMVLGQTRQSLVGVSANRALGSWLLRSELAHRSGVPQTLGDAEPWIKRDEYRGSLGAEYSGWHQWLVSLELNGVHTSSRHDSMLESADRVGQVIRVQYNSVNDRLTSQWWFTNMPGTDGYIGRWDLRYDWSDDWEFGLTLVHYHNEEPQSLFYPFRHHDSINAQAKFSF